MFSPLVSNKRKRELEEANDSIEVDLKKEDWIGTKGCKMRIEPWKFLGIY